MRRGTRVGSALLATLLAGSSVSGCWADGDERTRSSDPGSSGSSSPEATKPSEVIEVEPQDPLPPKVVEVSGVRTVVVDPDLAALAPGRPTQHGWFEYVGNPEQNRAASLHLGRRTIAINRYVYPLLFGHWQGGLVGAGDLHFRSRVFRIDAEGHPLRVRHGYTYSDVLVGPRRFVWSVENKDAPWGKDVFLLPADETRPRPVHLPDPSSVGPHGPSPSLEALAMLSGEDVLVRLSPKLRRPGTARYYSTARNALIPLPPRWHDVGASSRSHVIVLSDLAGTLAAYDSRDFHPLWTRTFTNDGRAMPPPGVDFTPSGQTVVMNTGIPGREAVLVDARSGRARLRVVLPTAPEHVYFLQGPVFEDDTHFLFEAYDGPTNPAFKPGDEFPSPEQLDYANTIVRCRLDGSCSLVARVPTGRSIMFANTVLFSSGPRPGSDS
jgi:hypothetical protein